MLPDPRSLTEQWLVEDVAKTYGDSAKGDVARTKADVTRIREAVGWEPRTTLEEGLARMWSWASGRVAAG